MSASWKCSDGCSVAASLALVGLGLMGSSLARALRASRAWQGEIIGLDAHPKVLERALELELVDRAGELASLDADITVFCVPVGALREVLATAREGGWPRPGQTATDVGSVKQQVLEDVEAVFGRADWFVPGHPLAGSERGGPDAGRADLFRERLVLLTPPAWVAQEHRQRIAALWGGLGARVEIMPAARHDRLLAYTSHLPHLLAFALVDTLSGRPEGGRIFDYAGTGFRDFTRIARSSPALWRDIFFGNRRELLLSLAELEQRLRRLRAQLEKDAREELEIGLHAVGVRREEKPEGGDAT